MPDLLIIGGGLFGSLAANYARHRGINALVFDPGLDRAASPAAAGLFKEAWAGKRFVSDYRNALVVLEALVDIASVSLHLPSGQFENLLHVSPRLILEGSPIRKKVDRVGDGWLEADGQRYEGWVYVANGIWAQEFFPQFQILGRAGTAFAFAGEQEGIMVPIEHGRQAIAFVRDPGFTYFSDGTAEVQYEDHHEQRTIQRAEELGLVRPPVQRWHGYRPYTPGGPLFLRISPKTWLATGGRKLGTMLGASLAHRLIETELSR